MGCFDRMQDGGSQTSIDGNLPKENSRWIDDKLGKMKARGVVRRKDEVP